MHVASSFATDFAFHSSHYALPSLDLVTAPLSFPPSFGLTRLLIPTSSPSCCSLLRASDSLVFSCPFPSMSKAIDPSSLPPPTFHHVDLPPTLLTLLLSSSTSAYQLHHRGDLLYWKDCAGHIRKELEAGGEGNGWHVVVGSSFGSHVTFEAKRIAFFSIGHMQVLAFKHG